MCSRIMFKVAALYHFTRFDAPDAIRAQVADLAESQGIRGMILIAHEGINGTISGNETAIDEIITTLRALPGCAYMDVKYSVADAMPFYRMKVRVKREIVTMGVPGVDPTRIAGTYAAATDWNALIADPDTVVIDTRNAFEVRIGSFAGAIDPRIASFREFPAWFRENRDTLLAGKKRVAMFCTGGIRCEKSTSFLKREGVEDVYHLQGGILRYLETVSAAESLWNGDCFVFDQRVAVSHALAPGSHSLCYSCREPLNADDMASSHYVAGVSCPRCHGTRPHDQQANLAMREKQMTLAAQRGEAHIGVRRPGG